MNPQPVFNSSLRFFHRYLTEFLFLQAPSNSPSAGSHCCFNPVTHFSFHFCIFLPSFECFPFLSFQVIISLNDRFNIAVVFAALVIITAEGRGDARASQLTCTGIHSCPLYFEQTCVSLPSVCVCHSGPRAKTVSPPTSVQGPTQDRLVYPALL